MSITTLWTSPPQDLLHSLRPRAIHVWRVPLDDSPIRASHYQYYLSGEELARAKRCHTPHPQYQFVVTRGILRLLLSRYMGVSPAQLQFQTEPRGKPALLATSSIPIQFNVSHTRGIALIAFSIQYPIGIDVECLDRRVQDRNIAERYFSVRESAYLASLPPPERTHQFFWYWTCKEAYLKMQGSGIAGGLAQYELTIDPDQCQVGIWCLDQQGEACSLYRIEAGADHVGAVATACSSSQISYWHWQDDYLS